MSLLSLPLPPPLPASLQTIGLPPAPVLPSTSPLLEEEESHPPIEYISTEPVSQPSQVEPIVPAEPISTTLPTINIEDELKKYGYDVKEKVIVRDDEGTLVKYIKAINPSGHKVFIEPDIEALVSAPADQEPLILSRDVTIQPYSLKHGVMELTGLQTRGIAFECHNGLCTLLRNESDLRPSEESFVLPSSKSADTNPVLYPIVRMSEIQANSQAVLRNSDEITMRLRNTIYHQAQTEMKKSQDTVKRLDSAFTDLNKSINKAMGSISSQIKTLHGYKQKYEGALGGSQLDAVKYRSVIDNLYVRHEMLADLLHTLEDSKLERSYLEEHIKKLNMLNQYVKTELTDTDYIL